MFPIICFGRFDVNKNYRQKEKFLFFVVNTPLSIYLSFSKKMPRCTCHRGEVHHRRYYALHYQPLEFAANLGIAHQFFQQRGFVALPVARHFPFDFIVIDLEQVA